MKMSMFCGLVLVAALVASARAHGMLVDPPNRGSMWRYGFDTPADYDDNQQFCGGRDVQWIHNNGNCGECGDDYALPRPRPHEDGGKYGLGVIGKKYKPGATFTAVTEITANHGGYLEFKVCALRYEGDPETQSCFNSWPIPLVDNSTRYYLPTRLPGTFEVQLVLPRWISGEQCVIQWTYVTGNSWGLCANGTGTLGCGPQETFRTCSDVTILN